MYDGKKIEIDFDLKTLTENITLFVNTSIGFATFIMKKVRVNVKIIFLFDSKGSLQNK